MAWGTKENLEAYTLAGAQSARFTVAGTKVTWADLSRSDEVYLYADKGAGHFTGDFTQRFKTVFTSSAVADYGLCGYMLSTGIGELAAQIVADYDIFLVKHSKETVGPTIANVNYTDGAAVDWDTSGVLTYGVVYYVTIEKVGNVCTVRIHTINYYGEAGSVEFDTLISDITGADTYQYLYAACSNDSGATGVVSGYNEDIDINEAVAAPDKATSPTPEQMATEIACDNPASLKWTNGARTATVNLYLTTFFLYDLHSAEFIAGEKKVDNQAVAAYDPQILLPETMYVWRVDTINAGGTTEGDLWIFTTGLLSSPFSRTRDNPGSPFGRTRNRL